MARGSRDGDPDAEDAPDVELDAAAPDNDVVPLAWSTMTLGASGGMAEWSGCVEPAADVLALAVMAALGAWLGGHVRRLDADMAAADGPAGQPAGVV